MLRLSLPELAKEPFYVPSPSAPPLMVRPSVYDVSKAELLMERAAPAAEVASAGKPQDVIRAVNAVLKDFTPEALSRMTGEELQGVAGVILDQLQGRRKSAPSAATAALLASASAERMLAQKDKPLRETLLNPGHTESHPDLVTVEGVPGQVAAVKRAEGQVFRHYTTEEGLAAILKSKALWNGVLSYVQLAPGVYKKIFKDVTGLFFTLPAVSGDAVGVPARGGFSAYVDVTLPLNVALLEIEKGAIYMVPLPARARGWVADAYLKWADGGAVASADRRMISDIDAAGGPGPELEVPVTIVGHGKVK